MGAILWTLLSITPAGAASEQKPPSRDTGKQTPTTETIHVTVPITSPLFTDFPIATVNDEIITVEEFKDALASAHGSTSEITTTTTRRNYADFLKRLIHAQLINQEARDIGLDELPEIKKMVKVYSHRNVRDLLIDEQVKDIKVGEEELEKLYRDKIKELKITALLFEKEADADAFLGEVRSGKSFNKVSKTAVAEGKAKKDKEGAFVKLKSFSPEMAKALSRMEAGSVSSPIKTGSGFVILRLEDVRYPESPELKEEARREIYQKKRLEVLTDYRKALFKQYVKFRGKTIGSLDYESKKPGFQRLLADRRVVATIRGDKPVTVGALTEALKGKFHHGVEKAIESKMVNERKMEALEEMLLKRILKKEALKRGIDRTEKHKKMVKKYENSLLFGAFIQRVIAPEIKLKEEDIKKYYDKHAQDYTSPPMVEIDGIAFRSRREAGVAADQLKRGTDFAWLKENAEGRVDAKPGKALDIKGTIDITDDLPEELRKTLSGALAGDFRLYAAPGEYFYVLHIQKAVPPKPRPFPDVKKAIAKEVVNEKLKKAIEEWAEKLIEAYDVQIYMSTEAGPVD